VSGNSRGRPPKTPTVSQAILDALGEKVHVTEQGKRKRVTKAQAIAKQIMNKGASGDLRASKLALEQAHKAEEKMAAAPPSSADLNAGDKAIVEGLFLRWRAIQEKGPDRGPDDAG
jgi:hypothetical protein